MSGAKRTGEQRPRELRRRVVLPARLRAGSQWSDACILNVSSRGLMIHSARAGAKDNVVELRRGEHVIVARVVWSEGARVGLQAIDRVPIEEIVSAEGAVTTRLMADGRPMERRRSLRAGAEDARLRGRALEFVGAVTIAASLATGGWLMAEEAFARPMALIATALG